MLRAYRQREIVRRVADVGFIQVAELSRQLRVDPSTVRRDLAALARAGLLERARGGALRAAPDQAADLPYDLKRGIAAEAKAAIGRAAAGLVADGQTILLDSGSTTRQMVPRSFFRSVRMGMSTTWASSRSSRSVSTASRWLTQRRCRSRRSTSFPAG